MTFKIPFVSSLFLTLFLVQNKECHVQPHANRTITAFFDLSRVKSLSRAELEDNYQSIVLSMRREGRNVLKYFHSDLLQMIFNNPHNETEEAIRERWWEQCDFLLENEDIDHFESYILSEDDRLIDGTNVRTADEDDLAIPPMTTNCE